MYPFGRDVRVHLYGRSHGRSVGCILEGIPEGVDISEEQIGRDMDLRRPSPGIGTPRAERDIVHIGYGVTGGRTDGLPIHLVIGNDDVSGSYDLFGRFPRPGHADLPACHRFGKGSVDRFSARLTAPLVAAGSIARQFISSLGIHIAGFTRSIGSVKDTEIREFDGARASADAPTRACTSRLDAEMMSEITNASECGDSVGGVAECIIDGLGIGDGGMWFDALDTELAEAMMGIPGAKGVEFGDGFLLAGMRGSESNDGFRMKDGRIITETNRMGGILGGLSTGMPLVFRVAFKPTPSIRMEQDTVDLEAGVDSVISSEGRFDACVVPRAVAVVEAMAALVVADQVMRWKTSGRR